MAGLRVWVVAVEKRVEAMVRAVPMEARKAEVRWAAKGAPKRAAVTADRTHSQ